MITNYANFLDSHVYSCSESEEFLESLLCSHQTVSKSRQYTYVLKSFQKPLVLPIFGRFLREASSIFGKHVTWVLADQFEKIFCNISEHTL
jgi:hypothetical protein